MGIAADLDYSFPPPNVFQRLMQQVASSRGGAWLLAKTLPRLDHVVGRLSNGRQSIPGLFTGLPVVDVTTTGRRSGLRRTSHLIAVPDLGHTVPARHQLRTAGDTSLGLQPRG